MSRKSACKPQVELLMKFFEPRMIKCTLQQELEDQELELQSSFLSWNLVVLRELGWKGRGRVALVPEEDAKRADGAKTATSPRTEACTQQRDNPSGVLTPGLSLAASTKVFHAGGSASDMLLASSAMLPRHEPDSTEADGAGNGDKLGAAAKSATLHENDVYACSQGSLSNDAAGLEEDVDKGHPNDFPTACAPPTSLAITNSDRGGEEAMPSEDTRHAGSFNCLVRSTRVRTQAGTRQIDELCGGSRVLDPDGVV